MKGLPWWLGGKESPAKAETWVRWSLGGVEPPEKEMATHSSIRAWEILWTEYSGGLQSMELQTVGHDWAHGYAQSLKLYQ